MATGLDSAAAVRIGHLLVAGGVTLPALLTAAATLVALSLLQRMWNRGGVQLHLPPNPSTVLQRAAAVVGSAEYAPPAWTALGGNIGTVLGNVVMTMRGYSSPRVTRTTVEMDGGATVGLDWVSRPATAEGEPPDVVVIVQHGLCGSTASTYVQELVQELSRAHPTWQVVIKLSRGCGDTKLTTPMGFTAARTSDLAAVVQHVAQKFPKARRVAVGFSLGSTLLGKYLGERSQTEAGLEAAVMLGPAWDFNIEGAYLSWPFGGWSANFLVQGLIRYVRRHAVTVGKAVDLEVLCQSRTVREFDELCIVPTCGYGAVEEYYADASACRVAHLIEVPTLALSAADDPVCNAEGIKSIASLGKGLMIAVTPTGGHIMWPHAFASTVSVNFLASVLNTAAPQRVEKRHTI